MGVRALTASAFNMTVGSGIFVLPATVALAIGGAAPVAYVICALAMALVVLCFAEAGSRVSATGGGYAYAAAAFGPYVGVLAGSLLYAGAGVLASAAVMNVFVSTLGVLVPALDCAGGARRAHGDGIWLPRAGEHPRGAPGRAHDGALLAGQADPASRARRVRRVRHARGEPQRSRRCRRPASWDARASRSSSPSWASRTRSTRAER